MAAFKGDFALVKLLLDLGADPRVLGPQESNVLHVCAERGFHEIAKEIVERDREKYKSMVF